MHRDPPVVIELSISALSQLGRGAHVLDGPLLSCLITHMVAKAVAGDHESPSNSAASCQLLPPLVG